MGTEATGKGQRRASIAVAGVALALLAASGGYLIGNSGGADLDAARAEGVAQGKDIGSRDERRGYAAGFDYGRKLGFRGSYATAYRQAFEELFKAAGLPSPGGTAPDPGQIGKG